MESKAKPEIVELPLTAEQSEALWPIVSQQAQARRGLLLYTASPVKAGDKALKLQCAWLEWPDAGKVLQIVVKTVKKPAE